MSSCFFTNRLWFYGARDIDHNRSKFEAFFNQHESFAFDVPTNEPKTLSSPSEGNKNSEESAHARPYSSDASRKIRSEPIAATTSTCDQVCGKNASRHHL
ncbi:hypothetical protein YC2023_075022 [Brassica napus]